MTATHAAAEQFDEQSISGIRPFDIGRDLGPVAELIGEAFASELDPRGTAALREMRVMSYFSGFLKLLNRTTGEFNDIFNGFVWVEEGAVVGNVTVQRADRFGDRWQIANVAVAPDYRQRGIARRLMDEALLHVKRAGGRWAVLQVYQGNVAACYLYDSLGFENLGGNAELRLDRVPALGPGVQAPSRPQIAHFHSFSSGHWRELYELANRQLSSQAQWWRAIRRADFEITFETQLAEWFWRSIGRTRVYRRCIQATQQYDAALVLSAQRWRGKHQIQLWVRPQEYGQYELSLLQWALATLYDYPREPIFLDLSTEHTAAIEVAQSLGFRIERTLHTMRLPIAE